MSIIWQKSVSFDGKNFKCQLNSANILSPSLQKKLYRIYYSETQPQPQQQLYIVTRQYCVKSHVLYSSCGIKHLLSLSDYKEYCWKWKLFSSGPVKPENQTQLSLVFFLFKPLRTFWDVGSDSERTTAVLYKLRRNVGPHIKASGQKRYFCISSLELCHRKQVSSSAMISNHRQHINTTLHRQSQLLPSSCQLHVVRVFSLDKMKLNYCNQNIRRAFCSESG